MPKIWHTSKGFLPDFENTSAGRAMYQDSWEMLDFLITDGTVVLLPDGDDEGSVLLMELLRAGFTGALVRTSTSRAFSHHTPIRVSEMTGTILTWMIPEIL